MTIEKYHKWTDTEGNNFVPVHLEGKELLANYTLNKGTAFTKQERKEFGLEGLLPPHPSTMEEQLDRVYEGFTKKDNPIEKYLHLRGLQDRNETLFYALVARHVEEMIPIIYTPTVGQACQEYSHRYQRARGLYITPANVDSMHEMVHHFASGNIKIIVATDNQGILGLGDLGVGGMGIPLGKLSLYTLASGIHPASCLPITLDVGTDNEEILNDPLYLGIRQRRLTGEPYATFIEKFVANVKKLFPHAVLQWEDFSKQNAFTNLDTYRSALSSFNDDIQGTGAVTLAGIIGAMRIKKEKLTDQKFAIFGVGAGGGGVTRQIYAGLMKEGLDSRAALERIFILDSKGVVLENREGVDDYKKPFAIAGSAIQGWKVSNPTRITLQELLENEKITVLIGTSTQPGTFTEDIVQCMMKNSARPVIFPLSNPTSKCEAVPKDIYHWSKGKAIIATGSPFGEVEYEGKSYRVGQGNNVFIFPAVGLAAIIGKASFLSDDVFTTSANAMASCVTESDLESNAVYPRISDLREVTIKVASECLKEIVKQEPESGIKEENIPHLVQSSMWKPEYLPYKKV